MKNNDMNIERAKRMLHNAVIALERANSPDATAEDIALMRKIVHGDENVADFYEFLDELADMNLEEASAEK